MRTLPLLLLPGLLLSQPVVVVGTADNDYESWIARLDGGRLMVVFDRNPDFRSGDLHVTLSADDGASWDSARPVIVRPGDQPLPCFIELPTDTVRLWYSSNETGPYRIHSAWSLDCTTWTEEGIVPLGWNAGSAWYYDPTVILEPDSSLTMLYSVQGMGAYVAHKPNRGEWDTLRTLVGPGGQRPRIIKHSEGTYLAAYQHRSGPGQYDIDIFIRTSTDRVDWTPELRLTDNLNSHDAFACEEPDSAYVVYYARYENGVYNLRRKRSYDAEDWSDEQVVTDDPVRNTQPHLFIEHDKVYLVYAHATAYPDNHDVYFWKLPYLGLAEAAPTVLNIQVRMPAVVPQGQQLPLDPAAVHDGTGRMLPTDNTEALPAGVYFIQDKTGAKTRRIVVAR